MSAEQQNRIAAAIHDVTAGQLANTCETIHAGVCPHCIRALAAAVHDPVIWAAVANARQAIELAARPIITRSVRPGGAP